MKCKTVIILLMFMNLFFAQTAIKQDSVFAKKIKIFNTNYKEFEVIENIVYAVTNSNYLIVFDLKQDKIIKVKREVISVAKNNKQEIVFLNRHNQIIRYKNGKVKQINIVCEPYKLMLDIKNNPIVISDKGLIYDNKIFEPLNVKYKSVFYGVKSIDDKKRVFMNPDLIFLDSKNRLWLTYDRGEFGEDILFFDLEKREFYKDDYLSIDIDYQKTNENQDRYFQDLYKTFPDKIKVMEKDTLYKFPNQLPIYNPIRGIVEKDGNFFISQSLIHFFINSYFYLICDFDNEDFYKSLDLTNSLLEVQDPKGFAMVNEFLGPLHLNKFNNSVYYYSDKGFFKIIEDEGKYNKEFIFKPWITWSATNRNNLGADINVTKFEFISENELVFLTTNNGIGYYNGTEVKYFQ